MSLVAKVFVVFNLIVSVVFMVFAMNVWTANTKWQKMFEAEKREHVETKAKAQQSEVGLWKQIVWEQKENEKQRGDIVQLKLKYNAERDTTLQLQTKLATVENQANIKEAENEELRRETKRFLDQIVLLQGVVRKQQQAVALERENAVQARKEKSEMETEMNMTKQTLAALQVDHRTVQSDLERQNAVIERLIANKVPVWQLLGETPVQPPVADAQVLAVRPDVGLIMISVGSQQNVKPGYRFTISRGDQFVAQVQVEKVYPEMCSARVVPGLLKGEIQVHDEAKSPR